MTELAQLTSLLQEKMKGSDLGASLKFDLGDDGVVVIDGAEVSNESKDTDCTISLTLGTAQSMLDGSLDPMMAFMQGKLRVEGDMGLAMKVGPMLKG